jgi:predicted Fe-S protein YdhL (DUF1289 family)
MEQSPCVRICTLNTENVCIGCGRNTEELKNWATFSDETKRTIKAQLKARLDVMLIKIRKKKE